MCMDPIARPLPLDADGVTRRNFLGTGLGALMGMRFVQTPMRRVTETIPISGVTRRTSAQTWGPEAVPADQLRALALVAMDAAHAAGADFADVRIGVQRDLGVGRYPGGAQVELAIGYGVRAWIDGVWSFQHGNVLTSQDVAATARGAVAGAREYAKVDAQLRAHRASLVTGDDRALAWAPAPRVTGEWSVPVEIDPFTVPLDDHQRIIGDLTAVASPGFVYSNAQAFGYLTKWHAETRVFASTDGSLVTQGFMRGGIGVQARAKLPDEQDSVTLFLPEQDDVCAGFESVLRPNFMSYVRNLFDEVVRWREVPVRPFTDVGRFPIVLDGRTMASLIGNTIDNALDGDRVSGIEADAAGGSFLTPAEAVLDAPGPQFSPLLTMRARRTLPSPMAAQWDDDGVVPDEYPVIDGGRVVDFHTTRETAPLLAGWYARHGRALRSHGCAVAPTPASLPRGTGGHLFVDPSQAPASLDALVREVSHGFLLINGGAFGSPGLTAGEMQGRGASVILEIRRGVPVARTGLRMQFTTNAILKKNLLALGDTTTMGCDRTTTAKGIPWQESSQLVTAPAAFCKDVDVIRWGA